MTVSGEFDLIACYLKPATSGRRDVVLGIGDDAAILRPRAGHELLVSVDTLNAGIHFSVDDDARAVGHKTLAVSLSDIAAMGGEPAWATLALSLPAVDEDWTGGFVAGLAELAGRHDVALVGGDTTRGPLAATLQILGFVPTAQALRRQGARPGDEIYVTGTLGDAGLALRLRRDGQHVEAELAERLDRPEPRLGAGRGLRGIATAAIDVSDGLLADLGHILDASTSGAELWLDALPRSSAFVTATQGWPESDVLALLLAAGDDYELCFTAPPTEAKVIRDLAQQLGLAMTAIGRVVAGHGVCCRYADGRLFMPGRTGFDHFATDGCESQA